MAKLPLTAGRVADLLAVVAALPVPSEILTTSRAASLYATIAALSDLASEVSTLSDSLARVSSRLDALVGGPDNVTSAIDSYIEIEAFLQGITNLSTLTSLLSDLRAEIVALIPSDVATSAQLTALTQRVAALEQQIALRPAVPSSPSPDALYSIKNGSYVQICSPSEQLLATVRSS